MLEMLYVFLPSIFAGIIQTTTGFGAGIFVMLFFPLFMPILKASALSAMVSLTASALLAWQYRKIVDYKTMLVPAAFYFATSAYAINVASKMQMGTEVKAYFGLFLVAVAIYFIFFSERIKIKANIFSAAVCGSISGVASGVFGIGGPPMVLFVLAAVGDNKEKYIANTQFFFALTGIYATIVRAFSGIITIDLLPLVIPGMIGMWIGKVFGLKIVERIDVVTMKKMIYIFLALSGLLTFVTNI